MALKERIPSPTDIANQVKQVEEIEMARFEIYMTLFLLELGIELSN